MVSAFRWDGGGLAVVKKSSCVPLAGMVGIGSMFTWAEWYYLTGVVGSGRRLEEQSYGFLLVNNLDDN